MAVNKVVYGTTVLVDLTSDTVDASHLADGYTAHDKSGNLITGTMVASSGGGVNIGTKTANGGGATSLNFTGLSAQPKAFMVQYRAQYTNNTTRVITSVSYDGTTTFGTWSYQKKQNGFAINYTSNSYFSFTYSNGTLTVRASSSTNGGVFRSGTAYNLIYVY